MSKATGINLCKHWEDSKINLAIIKAVCVLRFKQQ